MPTAIPLLRAPTAAITHLWAGQTGDHPSDCAGLEIMVAVRPKLHLYSAHSGHTQPVSYPGLGGTAQELSLPVFPRANTSLPPTYALASLQLFCCHYFLFAYFL